MPDWVLIEVGVSLDPKDWGSYIVIKPDLSRKGAEVKIKRTGRVRYTPPGIWNRASRPLCTVVGLALYIYGTLAR